MVEDCERDISQCDKEIESLVNDEQFDQADRVSERQSLLQQKLEKLQQQLKDKQDTSLEQAKYEQTEESQVVHSFKEESSAVVTEQPQLVSMFAGLSLK